MTGRIIKYFFHLFASLSIFGVFLSMFVENIGVPLPTEIGYLIARDLLEHQRYSYLFVLFILTLGHVVGSVVSYFIGRLGDNYIKSKLSKNENISKVHKKLEAWYSEYGNLTVFITRFVGYVRPWSSFVAGLAEVPFGPFLIWTTIGSVIFNIINIYFAEIFVLVWRRYEAYHFLILILIFLLFFGVFFYQGGKHLYNRHKKNRETSGK